MQIRTGHIPLNFYLRRIGKIDSDKCLKCDGHPDNAQAKESINHFIFECQEYHEARQSFSTLQSPTDSAGVQRTPLGPTGLQECHILSHICHILSHICDNMSHIFVTFCYILSRFVTFWSLPESGESGFYTIILSKTGLIWIIY